MLGRQDPRSLYHSFSLERDDFDNPDTCLTKEKVLGVVSLAVFLEGTPLVLRKLFWRPTRDCIALSIGVGILISVIEVSSSQGLKDAKTFCPGDTFKLSLPWSILLPGLE